MKNHIIFKFIAILLCAASLTGVVGGAAGIILLTSGDLYNLTVEEMLDQQAKDDVQDYANWLAQNYASTEFGGCSEELVNRQYGSHWFDNRYDPAYYGYAILDAEGEELLSFHADMPEKYPVTTYSNTISGKYTHLVSAESESQIAERNQQALDALHASDTAAYENGVFTDLDGETLPPEGAKVGMAVFTDAQGRVIYEAYSDGGNCVINYYDENGSSTTTIYAPDSSDVGFLYYNQAGRLVFRSLYKEHNPELFRNRPVVGFHFDCAEDGLFFQYQTSDNSPAGYLSVTDSRYLTFVTLQPEAVSEEELAAETTVPETVAETVPETIPETVPVTVPQETIVSETIAETTGETVAATIVPTEETALWTEATVPSSASALPENTEYTEASVAAEATEAAVLLTPTEAPVVPDPSVPAETASDVTAPTETMPAETVPAETVVEMAIPETVSGPLLINGKPLDEYQVNRMDYYDDRLQERVTAQFVYVPVPDLTVEIYMADGALRYRASYQALEMLRQVRNYLLPAIGICLLVFAVFTVYLCTAAGRKPKCEEVRAGGLNRLSLDAYLFGGGFVIACIIAVGAELVTDLLQRDFLLGCSITVGMIFLCCLIFVGFLFAFVSQIKTPGGYWWRNSLCGIFVRGCMRFGIRLETFLSQKGFPLLGRLLKKFWSFFRKAAVWGFHAWETAGNWLIAKLGTFFRWSGSKLNRWLSLMPLTWQWTIAGAFLVFLIFLGNITSSLFLLWVGLIGAFALILYGAHCFGVLMESTKKMGKGDLSTKVDDTLMAGAFKDFAADLNDLADVVVVAAQKQLKSERMKTELITNVSHDIKTPLTSIINYVDLLQKPHSEEEEVQYLEVLDRQSQRLKKLIDDLMDMSKANTGNMAVEITKVDAVESINQALGEFADKLDKAELIPVFRHSEDRVPMMADGKLVWRVLSNLLGNAVKYAMPGTRLYIDLISMENKVVISLKNISREELNVDADELMERFVRGDDSRNTEGSGLGLNIARSLMELQKGQLQLLVDGDLFKVTLIFPGA